MIRTKGLIQSRKTWW